MQNHSAENLTLDKLSRAAGISRFHFVTLFKKAIGATPHQYPVRLRLEEAAKLLTETDLSIQTIAIRCGFIDPSPFSNSFRRYLGQSPLDYRRSS